MANIARIGATLTNAQRRQLAGPVLSNGFTIDDRLYHDFREFSTVYQYPDIDLRGIREMLGMDGNPRKLEQVLTLPIRGADREFTGSGPALDLVKTNLGPMIDSLIDQCTSACAYRKSFHEIEWVLDGQQIMYKGLHQRPAVSCESAFDMNTGADIGFRQQLAPVNALVIRSADMGWIRIPKGRSFVFTYGAYREPLRGVSDLDVSLYCWDNIRKLQFLWCQYLESQSLPKVVVFGDDPQQAQSNADNIADADASSTIPMERPSTPGEESFKVIESSGKGADQFLQAINYFEGKQTQSVLASFMDLAQAASAGGKGSNALSADQSEFYLASRQAVADEMAQQITEGVIRPLVEYNMGPDVEVPQLHIGPLGNRQTDRCLNMITSILSATAEDAIPSEFTGLLINKTASFLGLDADQVAEGVDKWQARAEKNRVNAEKLAEAAANAPKMAPPQFGKPTPPPPGPGGQKDAAVTAAINMANDLVERTLRGQDPRDAMREVTDGYDRNPTMIDLGTIDLGLRSWVESLHPRDWHGRFSSGGAGDRAPGEALTARIGRLQTAIDTATPTHKDPALYDKATKQWAPHRRLKHAAIVNDALAKAVAVPNNGHAIMAGGLDGAGKSTVLGKHVGVAKGSYLTVNPDDIKEEMIKRGMVTPLPGMTPMESAFLIHEESSHIAGLLADRAQAMRKNMIYDITMSSHSSVSSKLDKLDAAGYTRKAGVFVDIPVEESVKRATERYERGLADYDKGKGPGGRFVPPDIIRENAIAGHSSKNRKTFDETAHRFDATAIYDNSGSAPVEVSTRGKIS